MAGLSRTSVEAMGCGLPLVGSRIGGLPATIADGVTGVLFEPGDAMDLARKLAVLLDDPALRMRMGLGDDANNGQNVSFELYESVEISINLMGRDKYWWFDT